MSQNITTANPQGRIVQISTHPKFLMVWGEIREDGKTSFVFVKPGVGTNPKYYPDEILQIRYTFFCSITLWAKLGVSARLYTAYSARNTLEWLRAENIDFFSPNEWPFNTYVMNPIDFFT